MSYQITDDGDEICIRATISQRWELAELVTKLQQRVDGLPVNLTTYVGVDPARNSNDAASYTPDVQDVNRKELSDER